MWAIDCSYDELTVDEAKRLRTAGVEAFGQCIWTGLDRPPVAEQNILNAKIGGMIPFAYLSVSPRPATEGNLWGGADHVKAGYDNLSAAVKGVLRHVALDVELDGLKYTRHVQPGVAALVARGYAPFVYTSYNAWHNYLGDPSAPAGWNLWNAYWDGDPDYDFARLPYGGGGFVLVGEQFTGGENVEGQFADRDRFEDAFFVIPPTPEVTRVITGINQELHDGDRVRFTLSYSDGSEPKIVEA